MDFHVVSCSTPFRWRGGQYTIDGCGMRDGTPYASTVSGGGIVQRGAGGK